MPIYPTTAMLNAAVEALAGATGYPMSPFAMMSASLLTSSNTGDALTGMVSVDPMSNLEFSAGDTGEISNTYGITFNNEDLTPTDTVTHVHFNDGADVNITLAVAEPFVIPAATNEGMTPGQKLFPPRSLVLRIRASA